jgi:hypothetical protein
MKQTDLEYVLLIVMAFFLTPEGVKGQAYRMELGFLGGRSFYMGDANNKNLFENEHSSYGLLVRYNLDNRFALKANALVAGISGTTRGISSAYMNGIDINFNNQILDAGVQLEVNFYNYGAPDYKPGSSRVSPYILLGLGFTRYKADKSQVCANIPFGLGIKAKVAPRINLGCEWTFRKTFADDLDYVNNTGGFQLQDSVLGSDSWNKNKDWYSILMLYISYDLYGIGSKCFR